MMHYSQFVVDKEMGNKNRYKDTIKTKGVYFQLPLLQKVISHRPHEYRSVFKTCVVANNEEQSKFLDLTEYELGTFKAIEISKLSDPNHNVRKSFRKHYRIDIKEYLKRAFRKQAYEIPLEIFEVLRLTMKSSEDENKYENWKTNKIFIIKNYFHSGNLKTLLDQNDERTKWVLKTSQIPQLFRQLLKCSVEFGGLDNFIMTADNVYFASNWMELHINYTSFTGIALFKAKSTIGPYEYFQIAPYLTQKMIQTGEIGVQQKIRFFLINCLSILLKENFCPDEEQVDSMKVFNYEEIKDKLKQDGVLSSKNIRILIEQRFNQSQIQLRLSHRKIMATKIKELITKALIDNQPLTWDYITRCICTGTEKDQIERSEEYGREIQKAFRQLHEDLFNEDEDKQFYISRNLESQLLYIPIKYRANFNLILERKAWWEIFNVKDKNGKVMDALYNFENANFAWRLAHAILKLHQKRDKPEEWSKNFMEDPAKKILFDYLKLDQLQQLINERRNSSQSQSIFN